MKNQHNHPNFLSYIEDLVDVVDHFDRALQASVQEHGIDSPTVRGLVATLKKSQVVLEKYGVTIIAPTLYEKFNHQVHHAISKVRVQSALDDTIQKCWCKGYMYDGKLIKPADVTVGVK